MNLLLKKSGGLFAKDFKLLRNGLECCVLSFSDWRYAEFLTDGTRFVIRSDSKARWVLEQEGTNVAYCKRYASGSRLEFSLDFEDRVWRFKPNRKNMVLGLDIWEGELKIGRISQHVRFRSSEVGAAFIQVPRIEIAGFAVWLIGIHWVGVAGKLTAARAEMGI